MIHGLWRQFIRDGRVHAVKLEGCGGGIYEHASGDCAEKLENLMKTRQLNSVYTNESFHKRNYSKHGACIFWHSEDYLCKAIDLYEAYDIQKALADANIEPEDEFCFLVDIDWAIKTKYPKLRPYYKAATFHKQDGVRESW